MPPYDDGSFFYTPSSQPLFCGNFFFFLFFCCSCRRWLTRRVGCFDRLKVSLLFTTIQTANRLSQPTSSPSNRSNNSNFFAWRCPPRLAHRSRTFREQAILYSTAMNLWLLAFAALAAVPTAFSQSTTSPLAAVAALPSCAVCAPTSICSLEIPSPRLTHDTARLLHVGSSQVTLPADKHNLRMHEPNAATDHARMCLAKLHNQRRPK